MASESRTPPAVTIALCLVAAMLEGADIISMGLAAPTVVRAFGFAPQQMAIILTGAVVGMMIGAVVGGRAGDVFGRKRLLVAAFLIVGVCSLLTTQATTFGTFLAFRFFCGLGLGAALPNLIAIVAEATRVKSRATSVSFMLAGQPVGGSLLGLFVASQGNAIDWRTIFVIGGVLPLMIVPTMILLLSESVAFLSATKNQHAARQGFAAALLHDDRAEVTLLLWLSYGFTLVVVYLINNWLPTLMVAKGFGSRDAALISSIENMGAVAGCILLAIVIDRGKIRVVMPATYFMMIVSLVALAWATGFTLVVIAGIMTGFFVVGGQLVLYTVAPAYYPTLVRATGVGSAVSAGRIGAIAGPLAAGELIALGISPTGVLLAATPCLAAAGLAVSRLVFWHRPIAHMVSEASGQ